MKGVIYARYSSYNQTEQSIDGQLRDCYAFAAREEITVVGEYIDRAITGRYDDRPDFQRMIADAKKKHFDYVIVWKLDRFSRNRYDSAIYKQKLKTYGVRVLSAMENIGDGDESIILEAVLEASAEYYSRDLAKKVKRGMRETALKGGYLGGLCPLGYKVVNGSVIIDEEKAPAVIYAFEQYAAGVSKKAIIDHLTSRGVRGSKGAPLQFTSFQRTFCNPKYTGEYTVKNGVVATNFPALISQELFDRVQARLKENARAPATAKAKIEYLLHGKLFCGMCGARMVGNSGTGKYSTYSYYSCGKRKKYRSCKKANEKKDFLEWYVVEQTVEYVLSPDHIDNIAEAVVAEYDKEFNDDILKALERRIAKADQDIENAVRLLISSGNDTLLKPTEKLVKELEMQKIDMEIDLAKLQAASGIHYTVDDIKVFLRQFCKGDLMDHDFRKRIIDVFINSVYLYDDKLVIFYNIRNGKQISYIDVADAFDVEQDESGDTVNNRGEVVRIPLAAGHHDLPNPNTPYYVIVNGVFGIVIFRQ